MQKQFLSFINDALTRNQSETLCRNLKLCRVSLLRPENDGLAEASHFLTLSVLDGTGHIQHHAAVSHGIDSYRVGIERLDVVV
jgi:hypothetical protein